MGDGCSRSRLPADTASLLRPTGHRSPTSIRGAAYSLRWENARDGSRHPLPDALSATRCSTGDLRRSPAHVRRPSTSTAVCGGWSARLCLPERQRVPAMPCLPPEVHDNCHPRRRIIHHVSAECVLFSETGRSTSH
jgi:hypothetical protein